MMTIQKKEEYTAMGDKLTNGAIAKIIDQMMPALNYLARVEAKEKHDNRIMRIALEMKELKRVIAEPDSSEEVRAYCEQSLYDLTNELANLVVEGPEAN